MAKKLGPREVWEAIESASGSVRLAAGALRVSIADVVAVLAEDPNAVITARRATVGRADSGPLPVFRLWVEDDDEDNGATRRT